MNRLSSRCRKRGSYALSMATPFCSIHLNQGTSFLLLTVPTAKPVVEFHHLAITHAGHTKNISPFSLPEWRDIFSFTSEYLAVLSLFIEWYFKIGRDLRVKVCSWSSVEE